ncbi:MAG TPA: VWA domain-containing protein [Thermoanaerobaculia bacterium]
MRSSSLLRSPLPGLLLILVPVALAALPAKEPKEPKPPAFEGSAQVVSVEVPVNVVSRDGEPVRDLTAADFEVYDDNGKQAITSFEVVDLKTMQEPGAPGAPEAAAPALPDLRPAARRHFLLLFDLSFSTPTSILKARLAARDFVLNSLHPTDLAAVATYSLETGPKLVVTFTPDRVQLARAVDTLGYRQALDSARVDPLHFVIDEPDTALLATASGSATGRDERKDLINQEVYDYLKTIAIAAQKEERSFQRSRISNYSRSLAEVAKALKAVQGRKQVIFFSEGFDSSLLLGRDTTDPGVAEDNDYVASGQHERVDTDQFYGNTSLQGGVGRMLDQFRRADCVIQAVDIGGLRAGADEQAHPSGEGALFYMANETGGELFKDANNLREPLDRVLAKTSVTYLLTFERSDLKTDGAYHRLKVKAKLPAGAKLTHRSGYYAPRPFQQLDPLERNLLASDGIASAAPRRDLDISVLTAPFRATPERAYVPVIIEANGKSLLAGEKGKKLEVEIYAYVSDQQGRMRDFFNRRVALDLDKGGARKGMEEGGIKYYGHFDLEPGLYHVRVLVRNADSGRTGVQTVPVTVPSYAQAQPILLPPFFMEDHQKWLLVREQTGGEMKGSVVYPFTVSGEPYVPAARPMLDGGKPARLCLVAYNFGKGDLAVKGEVLAADGKSAPQGKLSRVERTATGIQGLDKLVATFDPAGLSAGDYVLKVAVTDPATGHKQTNSLPFHVVR